MDSYELFERLEKLTTVNIVKKKITNTRKRFLPLKTALKFFGDPHLQFFSVHIAGSKGKGTTTQAIASLLHQEGKKTGCFLSPHVYSYKERIQLGDQFFDDSTYCYYLEQVITYIEKNCIQLRFFDALFLVAANLFAGENCMYGIFETGLGGKWDATNLLSPVLCIITNIEKEHTNLLGNTLKEIALHKIGIIKYKTSVLLSDLAEESLALAIRRARKLEAPYLLLKDIYPNFWTGTKDDPYDYILINKSYFFRTKISQYNRGALTSFNLALVALSLLEPETNSFTHLHRLESFSLPGRFEQYNKKLPIYFDGAHTLNSIKNVCDQFKMHESKPPLILFSCKKDKDPVALINLLFEEFEQKSYCLFSRFDTFSSYDLDQFDFKQLRLSHTPEKQFMIEFSFEKAIEYLVRRMIEEKRPILIVGSFLSLAKAKKELDKQKFY